MTIEYSGAEPVRLDTVVVSTQHASAIDLKGLLAPDVRDHVVDPIIGKLELDTSNYRLLVNPTGRFEIGGPMGDAGLTGRKIIIDTYGGMARHGGGAFSGKDPSKVDRSAAYAMRWVAKNVVAAGLAVRCETQVAYAIGKAKPVGLFVECFGTEQVPVERIQDAVLEVFDLRPAAIIRDLDLLRPIYSQTAAYGHFGREEPDFSWERTDRMQALRSAAGPSRATSSLRLRYLALQSAGQTAVRSGALSLNVATISVGWRRGGRLRRSAPDGALNRGVRGGCRGAGEPPATNTTAGTLSAAALLPGFTADSGAPDGLTKASSAT